MCALKIYAVIIIFVMSCVQGKHRKHHCIHGFKPCGDALCCCKNKDAYCKNKNLTYIPEFPGTVENVTFLGNNLTILSAEVVKNISLIKLKHLNLTSNGIKRIHTDTFTSLSHLLSLSLQNNNKLNYSEFSASLYNINPEVYKLVLDNTGLESLPNKIFSGLIKKRVKLRYIFLRRNEITEFNELAFYQLQYLKSLDLSKNKITKFLPPVNGSRLGHSNIEYLILKVNDLTGKIPWFCTSDSKKNSLYPKLKSLDLSNNVIMTLDRKCWACLKRLERLNLANNHIKKLENDIFVDLVSLKKLQVSYMAKPIQEIQEKAFHNLNLTELHFEHNKIEFKRNSSVPYEKLFTFCPNLTTLYLGYNNLRNITDNELVAMLSPLKRLKYLHLGGAELFKIPDRLLSTFASLTTLNLGKNKIQSINPVAFRNITKLETLALDANKISVINDTFPITLRHSLKVLHLSNNPFSCTFCTPNNNTWFRHWIDTTRNKIRFVGWPSYYKCASPPSEKGTLFQSHKPTEKDCEKANPMVIVYITMGTFLIFFTIVGITGYKTRWYLRYYAIKFRRKCTFKEKDISENQRLLENDTNYDAYVIYHDNDRAFVCGEFLRFMEEESPNHYKLFIWDRDFTAGDQTVAIVVDNMLQSDHVIAIISKSFLKDSWCDFQLAIALDRQIELKRHALLLITLEDIEKQLLNKAWCVLLTKTPVAEWCDTKNDIKRKLCEHQIFSNIRCKSANQKQLR